MRFAKWPNFFKFSGYFGRKGSKNLATVVAQCRQPPSPPLPPPHKTRQKIFPTYCWCRRVARSDQWSRSATLRDHCYTVEWRYGIKLDRPSNCTASHWSARATLRDHCYTVEWRALINPVESFAVLILAPLQNQLDAVAPLYGITLISTRHSTGSLLYRRVAVRHQTLISARHSNSKRHSKVT
jgi:hypothetical protein